jgi:membrane protease YdiL (CAAX protease family)
MNYKDQNNDPFALNEKIANAILFFLLFVRLADLYLPISLFGSNTREWYSGIVYILTAAIILLNRHRLEALNIDRPFIAVLLLGGVFYVFYLIQSVGIFVGAAAGLLYWANHTNQLVFKNPVPYPKGTGLLIVLTVLLALAPIVLFQPTLRTTLSLQIVGTTFLEILIPQLAAIVFEEVLFRGALWAYVRSLGFSDQAAFYTQAVLFWASHYALINNPYIFWIALPIGAILFGLMTWRSKSLTPSTLSHFLFNFTSGLMMKIFYS